MFPRAQKLSTTRWLTSVSTLSLLFAAPAHALPQGGIVNAGDASITQGQGLTAITQNSGRAVIDWQKFNVDNGERVEFRQPTAGAVTLNRIHDQSPSSIFGSVKANGQVVLINPNGILFGKNSKVDVAGMIASTADISNEAFMKGGALAFDKAGSADAKIVNDGSITVRGAGLAAFVAPQVENRGVIAAQLGKVQLAGAETATVDLYGDGLLSIAVNDQARVTSVTNHGRIDGQRILLTAADAEHLVSSSVNMDGILEASHSRVEKNGGVVLGGDITLAARDVTVDDGGNIRADGRDGAGTIQIGGGWQGKNIALGNMTLANAVHASVSKDTFISANATVKGDGGRVSVWADDTTRFAGKIEAKGGRQKGDGGKVETSGKNLLGVSGTVNASAAKGKNGEWLMDPRDVVISGAGGSAVPGAGGTVNAPSDTYTIDAESIEAALNNGNNVTITTGTTGTQSGNITFASAPDIGKTMGGDATLTLKADRTVSINSVGTKITSNFGKLNLVLWSDADNNGDGYVRTLGTQITTNGGYLFAGGGLDNGANGGTAGDNIPDNLSFGNSSLNDGVTIDSSTVTTGAGSITLRGHGWNDATSSSHAGVVFSTGALVQTTTGRIDAKGIGGDGMSSNYGVVVTGTSTVTSEDGDILFTGNGAATGSTTNNHGIILGTSSSVTSTGTLANASKITFNGTGGTGASSLHGIVVQSNSVVSSVNHDIRFTGIANAGLSGGNRGILINVGGQVISSGTGNNAANIMLDGTGSAGTVNSQGVSVLATGSKVTSVDGDITITGHGANGSTSGAGYGVHVSSGAYIATSGTGTGAGNISITGVGGNQNADNNGIYILGSTGLDTYLQTVAGNITLNGTGGNGTSSNRGVQVETSNGYITTATGTINITGHGGGDGTNTGNIGVRMEGGGRIFSTGSGSGVGGITIDGTGGSGLNSNYGFSMRDTGTLLTSVSGNIDITGHGGTSTSNNWGIYVGLDSDITSTGTGSNAANITMHGYGGLGTNTVSGAEITDAGTSITTVDGDIAITAQGGGTGVGSANYGFHLTNGALIDSLGTATGAGKITVNGTGGSGTATEVGARVEGAGSLIRSVVGDISITGTGGNSVTTGNAYGVQLYNSGAIASTGTGATAANITLNGTGGDGNSNARGVIMSLNGAITTVDGDISVTGHGGGSGLYANHYGINMASAAAITSTGTGTGAGKITLDGTGGNGSTSMVGVYMQDAGTGLSSIAGNILVTGHGGTGTGSSNAGINLLLDADITSTGTGANAANITLDGTGGTGGGSDFGVQLSGTGTTISTVDGDVDITGHGGALPGASAGNNGIIMQTQANIISTGTGAGAGKLSLHGTGGNSTASSFGTHIRDAGTLISSVDGDILFEGTGGNGGSSNHGIYIYTNAEIRSTGTTSNAAKITITGTGGVGGAAANLNNGVRIETNSLVTSGYGDISITGQGGSGTSDRMRGVLINNSAAITSTGTGARAANINITGTAGSGSDTNSGIQMTTASLSAVDGDITLRGTGGGTGAGVLDAGIYFNSTSSIATTGDSVISLTGTRGNNSSYDIYSDGGGPHTIGSAGTTGNITLTADKVSLVGTSYRTSGTLQFQTRTDGTSIGVAGGAGNLQITSGILDGITSAGNILIGNSTNDAALTIEPYASWAARAVTGISFASDTGNIVFNTGAQSFGARSLTATTAAPFTLAQPLSAGRILLRTTGAASDITLNPGASLTASAAGDAIRIASGDDFINTTGTNPFSTPAGRWLIYSQQNTENILGPLTYAYEGYSCIFGGSCGTIPATGNGILYSVAAIASSNPPPVLPPAPPPPPPAPPPAPEPLPQPTPPISFSVPSHFMEQATIQTQQDFSPASVALDASPVFGFSPAPGGAPLLTTSAFEKADATSPTRSGKLVVVTKDLLIRLGCSGEKEMGCDGLEF